MKMNEVFILPVVAISDGRGGRFIPMESNQQADAAAHAINQHDKLVELNKELVELMGEMNEGYSADIRADELIKRAKELNK